MDTKTRAEVVRFFRELNAEEKQARGRAPRPQQTPQEERDRNFIRQSRSRLRRRRPAQVTAEREQLRRERESGRSNTMGDQARNHIAREANVRLVGSGVWRDANGRVQRRTSGGAGRTISPSERLGRTNRNEWGNTRDFGIGEASRRRAVSPGVAPPARGEAGHADAVRRYRRGTRNNALRRGDLRAAWQNR